MVLRSTGDGVESDKGAVFVDRVLFFLVFFLLVEDLLYRSTLQLKFRIKALLKHAVVQCLQYAINVIADIKLAVRVN